MSSVMTSRWYRSCILSGIKAVIRQPVRLEASPVTPHLAFLDSIRKIIARDNKQLPKEVHDDSLEKGRVTPALEIAPGYDWPIVTTASWATDPVSQCDAAQRPGTNYCDLLPKKDARSKPSRLRWLEHRDWYLIVEGILKQRQQPLERRHVLYSPTQLSKVDLHKW